MAVSAVPAPGLAKGAIGGVLWLTLSSGAQALAQALALIILARLLVPEDFGVVGAAMIIVGFSTIFSQLGVGPAIFMAAGLTIYSCVMSFAYHALVGDGRDAGRP